jgi:hypothetical protein
MCVNVTLNGICARASVGVCAWFNRFFSFVLSMFHHSQAPLLNTETAREATEYTHMLKAVIESSYRYARFVLTGSIIAPFLHNTRSGISGRGGYTMWLSASHVLLGKPLSFTTEREIMSIVLTYYRQKSGALDTSSFSADQLLDAIKSHKELPTMLHIRPAVLDVIAANLFARSSDLSNVEPGSGEFVKVVHASISRMIELVNTETLTDAIHLLDDLQPRELAFIHKLAIGEPATLSPASILVDRTLDHFASLACGLPLQLGMDVETPRRQLLPPYSTYFAQLIDSDGMFTEEMEMLRVRRTFVPTNMFLGTTFFCFRYSEYMSAEQQASFSQAVMEHCASHGIGIRNHDGSIRAVASMRELHQCPLMAKLRQHTMEHHATNLMYKEAILRQEPVCDKGSPFLREVIELSRPGSPLAAMPPGIALLCDMRSHTLELDSDFKRFGWNLGVLHSIIREAHRALRRLDLTWLKFASNGAMSLDEAEFQRVRERLEESLDESPQVSLEESPEESFEESEEPTRAAESSESPL